MSVPPEIITAVVAGIFAFAGAALAQLGARKRTAAEAEKFYAEAEKFRAEAEALRWQSEKAAAERAREKKALDYALAKLEELQDDSREALQKLYLIEQLKMLAESSSAVVHSVDEL